MEKNDLIQKIETLESEIAGLKMSKSAHTGFKSATLNRFLLRKRFMFPILGFICLISAAFAFAADIPHNFSNGSPIDAKLINQNFQYLVPTGSINAFGGSSAPSGWLECNGAEVSRTRYARLFSVIGTNFGAGDGSTTFNLPDLRGKFARGWDHGAGRDPSATKRSAQNSGGNRGDKVGSVQAHALQDHKHITHWLNSNANPHSKVFFSFDSTAHLNKNRSGLDRNKIRLVGQVREGTTDSETRPVNVFVMYLIKT